MAVITGMTTGIFTLSVNHQAISAQPAAHRRTHTTVLTNTALAGFAIPATIPIVTAPSTTTPVTTAGTPPVTTPTASVVPPPPPPVVPVTDATSVATADWACIRVHESGDQYNNPNDPSGAYGILLSTWRSFGYSGWPYEAAASVQDQLALKLYSLYGFHPWSSRFACGL
jgi:Transglycosylase-like domain